MTAPSPLQKLYNRRKEEMVGAAWSDLMLWTKVLDVISDVFIICVQEQSS